MLKKILEFISEILNYFWFYIKLFFSLFFMYYILKNNLLYSFDEITYLNKNNLNLINDAYFIEKIEKNEKLENSIKNVQEIVTEKGHIKKITALIISLYVLRVLYNYIYKQ